MSEKSGSQGSARLHCSPVPPGAVAPCDFDSPLPSSALNLATKSRSNLFPWRGQFSPQLVETLLRAYAAPGASVLDPFMGSGTVLVESARLGLPSYGYEVNPAGYILARVYELCTLPKPVRMRVIATAERILAQAEPTTFHLPLFPKCADGQAAGAGLVASIKNTNDPNVQIVLEALVVLLDDSLSLSNVVATKWATIRRVVLDLPYSTASVRASLGDARLLHMPKESIDFVLSSPPYINVFNYHHNSRSAIEALGWKPLVAARSEIGSNRKFRQNRFLTVVQYCIDIALALIELRRVCRPDARIILILGRESFVHKTAFYNGQIVERIATEIVGMRCRLKQERVFVNRFGHRIYEDILHFTPGASRPMPLPKAAIIEEARSLGTELLRAARGRTRPDREHLLLKAITESQQVQPSMIFHLPAATEVCK